MNRFIATIKSVVIDGMDVGSLLDKEANYFRTNIIFDGQMERSKSSDREDKINVSSSHEQLVDDRLVFLQNIHNQNVHTSFFMHLIDILRS